jgi:hypothetical protein
MVRFVVIAGLFAIAVGYSIAGVPGAIVEGVLFGLVGTLMLVIAPQSRPLKPEIIPRPIVDDSPESVRNRRTARIMLLSLKLPLVLGGILLVVVLPWGPAAYAMIALTVAYVVRIGYFLALTAVRGERFDRLRERRYERLVARLEADRRSYEAKRSSP